jgi:hypothetical protein
MGIFVASVTPAAAGTTNDALTFTGAASGRSRIHEVSVSGLSTTSVANTLCLYRPSTLGITPTALSPAPKPVDVDGATMLGTVASGWATQPVVTSSPPLLNLGCNSNGGVYRWVAKPGEEISYRGTATASVSQLSLRFAIGGAQQMAIHAFFEE